jgi:hypothetical protein
LEEAMRDPEKTAKHLPTSTAAPRGSASGRATVAIAFVRECSPVCSMRAAPPRPLLERANIAPALLDDPSARIPVDRYAELYNLINAQLDDEGFGLFSVPMRCGAFEFLCRSTITAPPSPRPSNAASAFCAWSCPISASASRPPTSRPACASPRLAPLLIGRVFAFEWLLRLLHGLLSWLIGRAIVLDSVAFPLPPPTTRRRLRPDLHGRLDFRRPEAHRQLLLPTCSTGRFAATKQLAELPRTAHRAS